jgi:predicted nucleic acid-binding protein
MIALDTNIVIAALMSWHEHHERAAAAVEKAMTSRLGAVIPLHVFVEAYAVLTRLPPPYRLAPRDALVLLRENFESTRVAPLPVSELWALLDHLAEANLGGGVTYDAAILASAESAGATVLMTMNARDYERLSPRIRIESPAIVD